MQHKGGKRRERQRSLKEPWPTSPITKDIQRENDRSLLMNLLFWQVQISMVCTSKNLFFFVRKIELSLWHRKPNFAIFIQILVPLKAIPILILHGAFTSTYSNSVSTKTEFQF